MKKIILCLCLFIVYGCSEGKREPGFINQYSAIKKGDGWVLYCIIEKDNNEETPNRYILNGVNLKYKNMEGYYLPVLDENGNEISQEKTSIPMYIHNPNQKEDILNVNQYFDEKQFNEEIQLSDLDDLELQYLNKEGIVQLFNQALKDQYYEKGFGPYNIKESNCVQKTLLDGSILQLSYVGAYGYIRNVNIEYINSNHAYLSDLVVNHEASEEEIAAQESLDQLEKDIVKNQKANLENINAPMEDDSHYLDTLESLINEVFIKR